MTINTKLMTLEIHKKISIKNKHLKYSIPITLIIIFLAGSINSAIPQAFADDILYSIQRDLPQLHIIDPADGSTLSSVTITCPTCSGTGVKGGTGLATDPTTGQLYAILQFELFTSAPRELVTIDPVTGVATSIGGTGGAFATLAFDSSGTLYGVTGDGSIFNPANVLAPETLFTLSKTDASSTLVCTLGNGEDGEAIAFDSNDTLYHASGLFFSFNQIFETVNLTTCMTTNIPLSGDIIREVRGFTYWESQNVFLLNARSVTPDMFLELTPGGVATLLGDNMTHVSKGLAFNLDSLGPTDTDGDFIFDEVDPLPNTFSDDFSDGTTDGTITARGDQTLAITDEPDPDGVRIVADIGGGLNSATVDACSGASTITLNPGDEIIVTCASVTVKVISGTVIVTFTDDSGQTAIATITSGNEIIFEPQTFTISAPSTNSEPVTVEIDGVSTTLDPGSQLDVDAITENISGDLTITSGQIISVKNGATVSGNVIVDGGSLILSEASTVTGNIEGKTGSSISVQDSTVEGNVVAKEPNTSLEISNGIVNGNVETQDMDTLEVTASDINGNILSTTNGDVTITDNTVNGNIEISGTTSCSESGNNVNGNNSGCP